MPLPVEPNISQGQIALDPVNGIVWYVDSEGTKVSTAWSWLKPDLDEVETEDNVTITGNLTVQGTTVTVDAETVIIQDNFILVNSTNGSATSTTAGIEVERGALNNVQLRWNESTDKWQFTNDGTTFLDLNSIVEDSVTLGLHTTGNYVKNLVAGTGITLSDNSGEGATPTISIGQDISTGATVNFSRVIAPLTGNVTGNLTGNVAGNVTGNVTGTVSDISNHGINALSDVTITSSADGDFLRWTGSAWVNDAVNLTSDTVGDYVKNLVQGNGITISNNSGEGATPGIAIDTSIVQTRVSNVTDTEIGYLDGVTSAIQTQINSKAPTSGPTFTGTTTLPSTTSIGNVSDAEIGYLDGVTSAIQTQLNTKAPTASPTFTGTVTVPTPIGNTNASTKAYVDSTASTTATNAGTALTNHEADTTNIHGITDTSILVTTTGTQTLTNKTITSPSGLVKGDVSLGNVDNTSDANKPVSTAQQTALDLKANSATPTFTGMVTAPLLTVSGIQIDASGPSDTNVLKYSSALNKYIPGVASTVASLDDLTDVIITSATPNQVLKYDGTNWVNAVSPSSVEGTTHFATIGNGTDSTFVLNHNLTTRDIVVNFTETSSPYASFTTLWEATTLNSITVYFETPPSSNSVRVGIYAAVSGVSLSTDLDSLNDVALSGLANGDFLRYNGSNWINDPVNLSTDTVGDYVSSLVQGTGITITNNSGEGATPTISVASSTYQPLDADLTAIAALAGTSGILKKTAADTWALDTNTYITSLALDQLTDVNAVTPSNDQVLAWQSSTSEWISKTFSASVATLDSVGDVSAATPSSSETLQWNGSAWVSSTIVNANVNASAAITYSKLSLSNSVDYTDLKDGPAKAGFRSTLNDQTGTTYTLVLTDLAKLVTLSNAGAITLTVPLNSSVAFAIGDRIDLLQKGAGQVTVAAAGGVTINSTPGLKLRAQWSSATLVKLDTNTWVLIGDLQS